MPYSLNMDSEVEIRTADWERDEDLIFQIRTKVFVEEQNVPPEHERDGRDPDMIHVLALYKGKAVGTARMSRDGHIGRVAVLSRMRGKSIGAMMMEALEQEAARIPLDHVHLNAQVHARGFYERRGYSAEGESFLEAGISHIHMNKSISKSL